MHNITCPVCGGSYYIEMYNASTAVYYPPVYKNGVNINPDMNETTTCCECMNCHTVFYYATKGGELTKDGFLISG